MLKTVSEIKVRMNINAKILITINKQLCPKLQNETTSLTHFLLYVIIVILNHPQRKLLEDIVIIGACYVLVVIVCSLITM